MSNSTSWPIDRTLSGATTPDQNGPESNGNERVLHISESSSITRTSPSDCLVLYPGHSLREFNSCEVQYTCDVYTAAASRHIGRAVVGGCWPETHGVKKIKPFLLFRRELERWAG